VGGISFFGHLMRVPSKETRGGARTRCRSASPRPKHHRNPPRLLGTRPARAVKTTCQGDPEEVVSCSPVLSRLLEYPPRFASGFAALVCRQDPRRTLHPPPTSDFKDPLSPRMVSPNDDLSN